MREAHVQLKLAETALRSCPDKLVSALACVVAAQRGMAGGRATAAVEMIRRAREEWSPSPPGWLEVRLAILESRAWTAAGDAPAAVAAAQRADSGPEAAAALAHAWLAAGDEQAARRVLGTEGPESAELGAGAGRCPAQLRRRGRRARSSLPGARAAAGQAGAGEAAFRHGTNLAAAGAAARPRAGRRLPRAARARCDRPRHGPAPRRSRRCPLSRRHWSSSGSARASGRCSTHASGMLSTAEIATEMYLSVNTVKTHLRSIYRKLSATHRSEAVRRAQQLELI